MKVKNKEEMLKQAYTGEVLDDLKSPDWCFGRGTADMKAGDACIICELFKYAQEGLKEVILGVPRAPSEI